jgi:hypothetical protein
VVYTTMHTSSQDDHEPTNYLTFGLDREAPIVVKIPSMQADQQAQNEGLLGVAEILGRRTQVRVSTEVWCKWRGRWRYKRLRARHVTISWPNPEQAGLVIDMLTAFLQQLDGTFLVE